MRLLPLNAELNSEKTLYRIVPVVVCLIAFAPGFSQEGDVGTNLEQMRAVAQRIAARAARDQVGVHDSINATVLVLPRETAWYVERAIWDGLKSEKVYPATSDSSSSLHFEFGLSDMRVVYENIHRESMFGSKVVERIVGLSLDSKLTRRIAGERGQISSILFVDSVKDVVELSEISRLENPAIVATKGRLPREGFFANIAEPLVLIGSIAVAVLLLFSVRS